MAAERIQVRGGAGGVEEGRGERARRRDRERRRQAVEKSDGRRRRGRVGDLDDLGKRAEGEREVDRTVRRRDEVDAGDDLGVPPHAPGHGDRPGEPGRGELLDEPVGAGPCRRIQEEAGRRAHRGDAAQDVVPALRPEALEARDAPVEARGLQRLERVDAQGLVQGAQLARAEPGDAQAVRQALRVLRAKLVVVGDAAGADQLRGMREDRVADSRHLPKRTGRDGLVEIAAELHQGPSAVLVGADLELVRAGELEHLGHVGEHAGEALAVHGQRVVLQSGPCYRLAPLRKANREAIAGAVASWERVILRLPLSHRLAREAGL